MAMQFKKILVALLFIEIALAAIDLLPRKISLLRKYGSNKTNDELIPIARSGDAAAAKLYKRTRIWLGVMISTGALISFL